jgi:hypothetical protein
MRFALDDRPVDFVDGDSIAAAVVRSGQQHFQFIRFDFAIELGQLGIGLGLNGILPRLRFGLAQFQEHQHIIDPLAEADQRFGFLFQ